LDTKELGAALHRREEAALTQLYDRYGSAVYAFVLRMTGDAGMAEEVTLDAFLHVWDQAHRFDASSNSLPSWLFTVARSRAIDRLRAAHAQKRTRVEDHVAPQRVEQPDEMVEVSEQRRLVRDAIRQLSQEQRRALELAYYEGLSHSEIAARLGEPLGTVKTRIRQAMLVLRRTLGPVLSPTS
jgi:RNA polymerase sigma-70 factor (ECF subfamily)